MELISFLLPKTELDWVFFSAIVLCFIVTLFAALKVRQLTKERIRVFSLQSSAIDEDSIRNYLINPRWEVFLESGASFALIIGLLGTFLGIGLAIQDASKVIASLNEIPNATTSFAMDTIGQLTPVLSDIGTKFKVSAWGISTHILMRLLIPLFGISMLRHEFISQKVNEAKNIRHQDRETLNNDIRLYFNQNKRSNQDILSELKKVVSIPHSIEKSLLDFKNTVATHTQDSNGSLKKLTSVIDTLQTDITVLLSKIDSSIKDMDLKASESFEELITMNKTVVTDSMQNLKLTNEQAITLIDSLHSVLNSDSFKDISQSLEITNHSTESVIQQLNIIKNLLVSASVPVSDSIDKVDSFLTKSLSSSQDIQESIKTNKQVLQSIEANMLLLEKVNRNLLRLSADRTIMLDNS